MGLQKIAQFPTPDLDRQLEEVVFYGREGWTDELGAIGVRGVGANDPTWKAFSGNGFGYAFEKLKMNQCWVDFHIDHHINPAHPVYIHLHWSPADDTAGNVRWGVEILSHGNPTEAFTGNRTFYMSGASLEAFPAHHVVECTDAEAIPGGVLIPGGIVKCRLFRDPTNEADTYAGDAFPWFLNLHYRADRQGTPSKTGDLYK